MSHPTRLESVLATVSQTVFNPKWIGNVLQAGCFRIKSWWGQDFPHPPVWPWGPSRPLYKGYRVSFLGVKWRGRGVNHAPHLEPRLQKNLYYPSFPTWQVIGWTLAFLGAFTKLQKVTITFILSVRLSTQNNSAPTEQIVMKFDTWVIFRKSVSKIQVSLKSDKNNGTLHED